MLDVQDVYVYEVMELEGGGISRGMIGYTTKLVITSDRETNVDTPITLTLHYEDWQGNPLPEENRAIKVSVINKGDVREVNLTPANGQAQYTFTSGVIGTFKIRASADFACDRAGAEVRVV